ncbi:MAG: type IX secretion system sortase PorU [Bacteroidales bacterium]|nr:type IX secretion system sortase PorU [Bacteroidales bacterium]
MKYRRITFIAMLLLLLGSSMGWAQVNTYNSVLSEHTWYRLSVTQEGAHQLDYATLQGMGIDMGSLNPSQIRLFGNPSGALPEKNADSRPDDLTEMAICVTGADDGSFDEGDVVLFYGQEPTRWVLVDSNRETYRRERNYYSDTTYYYLCVDSGVDGLRVGEKPTLPVENTTAVISDFPDFVWHEEELFSPYSIGQNWFGEQITSEDSTLTIPFVFPNLAKNKYLRICSQVLGRIKKSNYLHYNAWVNDNHVADNVSIKYYGDHEYGKLSTINKQIVLDSDTAVFELSFVPFSGASLYLDYVEIYGWRQLIRSDDNFLFRLMPSQFGDDRTAIWVQNVNADFWLWDVSTPLRPMLQDAVLSADNMVFATNERTEKRYVLFLPTSAYPIVSWSALPNQNLHAITAADNLILTSPIFLEQAQELADYHAAKDDLTCIVVDVNEIYNEFSTGTLDPTGIRDFVRMVYRRSSGQLKYLTLFGRTSFDFRDIKGYGQNYVPTYETMDDPQYELSFATDDFFALMDNNEGVNSYGHVDIGVGRISVSTVEEAETMLRKIKHYDDLSATYGEWKADLLLLADDEKSSYVNYSEGIDTMIDSECPALTRKKLYCGAYPLQSTANGTVNPGANADLQRAFDQGLLAVFYNGHGGVKGLTGENVFANADIAALANYDKMPFIYTATCEFTKYDNPLLVSAGEQLFLNPRGGCVALFTTCRPTFGDKNYLQTRALVPVLLQRDDDGMPLRYGDIVRLAKSDPLNFNSQGNQNIRFLFLGDPVLRFPLPQKNIAITRINGMAVGVNDGIELHAMSMVTMEGEIWDVNGRLDAGFNGTLWVRFYDQKTKVVVKFADDSTKKVYYHKDVLYQGQVTVKAGKFSISFQIPKEIKPGEGAPRFSFYAYDSIRSVDAMGKFDDLLLGGIDPAMVPDDEGPKITFYWNTPDFENGQVVEHQGVLYAELYDAQGIYHYGYSLGRDIVLNSNLAACNHLVLNDRYEPAMNDFRRGRIALPLSDLEPGTYEFTLKAWDTQDNASEASIWFVVDDNLFLSQVRNYPNPFDEETRITMTHIGEDGDFDVNIEIFDIMGRSVQHLYKKVYASDGVIEPIVWDGCDYYGTPLRSGIYLYRLTLTDETGYFRTVSQRMVIQR